MVKSKSAKNVGMAIGCRNKSFRRKSAIGKKKKTRIVNLRKSLSRLINSLGLIEDFSQSHLSNSQNETIISTSRFSEICSPENDQVHPSRQADDSVIEVVDNLIEINDDTIDLRFHDDDSNTDVTELENHSPAFHCSTPLSSKNKRNESFKRLNTLNATNDSTKSTINVNTGDFLTIDLTTETNNFSINSSASESSVIDLCNTITNENDIPQTTQSLVTDNDTTVICLDDSEYSICHNLPNLRKDIMRYGNVAEGISKLSKKRQQLLLDVILKNGVESAGKFSKWIRKPDTAEDSYIKEIIVKKSVYGTNVYNPQNDEKNKKGLRMIVIDGSNVAMEHTKGLKFSVEGLKTCIDYFVSRGHVVKAFVPRFRCKYGKSTNSHMLDHLERSGLVVYTPSREIRGRLIASYDDRYIVQCAAEFDGVIVSGDNYRDLASENQSWRNVIENRLLPFTWVNNMIIFPQDPLGRYGPTLDQFLRHCPQDPLGRYGPTLDQFLRQ